MKERFFSIEKISLLVSDRRMLKERFRIDLSFQNMLDKFLFEIFG